MQRLPRHGTYRDNYSEVELFGASRNADGASTPAAIMNHCLTDGPSLDCPYQGESEVDS